MQKLKILTTNVHEAWLTNICKTGHDFYGLMSHERPNGWKTIERDCPHNWTEIDCMYEDFADSEFRKYDILLINTPQQRVFANRGKKHSCIRVIEMNHCFPCYDWDLTQISWIRENCIANTHVFATKENASAWMHDGAMICGHTVDESIFKPIDGGTRDYVLSVAYDFVERGKILGYDDWKQIVSGIKYIHIGNGENEIISTANELANNYYFNACAFINTAILSPIPTVMLEAMACGCPVVSKDNSFIRSIFNNEENGFIYNNVFQAKKYIEMLLADRDYSSIIGSKSRELYNEKFSTKLFVDKWNNIFEGEVF